MDNKHSEKLKWTLQSDVTPVVPALAQNGRPSIGAIKVDPCSAASQTGRRGAAISQTEAAASRPPQ